MKENKKYSTAEIVCLIFCSLGCLLMMAPIFFKSGTDMFFVAIALNGIGLMAFLYSRKSNKVD